MPWGGPSGEVPPYCVYWSMGVLGWKIRMDMNLGKSGIEERPSFELEIYKIRSTGFVQQRHYCMILRYPRYLPLLCPCRVLAQMDLLSQAPNPLISIAAAAFPLLLLTYFSSSQSRFWTSTNTECWFILTVEVE